MKGGALLFALLLAGAAPPPPKQERRSCQKCGYRLRRVNDFTWVCDECNPPKAGV